MAATVLNFVGAGVTATRSGETVTVTIPGGAGSSTWGGITGTLSNQTDLQTALNGKLSTGLAWLLGSGGALTAANTIDLAGFTLSYVNGANALFDVATTGEITLSGRSAFNGIHIYRSSLLNVAYGIKDNSVMTVGGGGYAVIDAAPTFGTSNNYIDCVGLQWRPSINTSAPSVLTDVWGSWYAAAVSGGTVTNNYGTYVVNVPPVSGGFITNNYGHYVEGLTAVANNWAYYASGTTANYFGGSTTIGNTNSWNFNPSTAIAALNIQSGGTSGSVDIKYNGTLYQGMRLDGMTSEARWYAVAGYSSVLYANGAEAMRIDATKNIICGTAALATNATAGFLYIPTCAGAPSGTPAATVTGRVPIIYDTTNNFLYVYNGGWKKSTVYA